MSNFKNIRAKFLLILIISLSLFCIQKTTRASIEMNSITSQIELDQSILLDALTTNLDINLVDSIKLESSFVYDGESIQDFQVFNSNASNLKSEYLKNRKAFIANVKKTTKISSMNLKSIESIPIKRFSIVGRKDNIEQLQKNLNVKSIYTSDMQPAPILKVDAKKEQKKTVPGGMEEIDVFSVNVTPMYLSVPKSGSSRIESSFTRGRRFVLQRMKWNTISFTNEQAYEHELWLHNYDVKTYLNPMSTGGNTCYPVIIYSATSWPLEAKPYLDTRSEGLVGCESTKELSYTIGVAQANALKPNIEYYTYIETENGNDITDKFKLQAQIGHRFPSFTFTCPVAVFFPNPNPVLRLNTDWGWCVFSDKIYKIIPFPTGTVTNVPGIQSWVYNGQAPEEAPSNLIVKNVPLEPSKLEMTFKDNTFEEIGFVVERKTGNGVWNSVDNLNALAGANAGGYWKDNGTPSGTSCYRLKAINAIGSSPYSNEACGTTLGGGTIPPAPSNVSVTNPLSNSLRISFQDNATNETSTNVERKIGAGNWSNFISLDSLPGAQNWHWVDSGLISGTTYCYRLKSINTTGSSQYSNEGCGTTAGGGTMPLAPSEVYTSNATINTLRVNFRDNAINENYFSVERKVGTSSWMPFIVIDPLSGTGLKYFTDTNLSSGVTYCYRFRAFNDYGYSSYSNEACGTTTDTGTIPNPPSNVFISNPTTTTLRLNFKDNSLNENWFAIERKTGVNGTWGWIKTINALSGNYTQWITDTGLFSHTAYCYRMVAINGNGTSPYSGEGCGNTLYNIIVQLNYENL